MCEGEEGIIITAVTPFYATMGGQQGDQGVITTEEIRGLLDTAIAVCGGEAEDSEEFMEERE